MKKIEMKDIVELSKIKWFVYQWSEIYWWLANTWDYGPYGILLKENIKNAWIKAFVQERTDMVMLDAAILMNSQTWVASGHVSSFSDPLTECKSCHTRNRADKMIEEKLENDSKFPVPNNWAADKTPNDDLNKYIHEWHIECPNCGTKNWTDIIRFNLMLSTHLWVNEESWDQAYLRPETAQWIFVNFANVVRSSRRKVPFGIAQCGKAFRNEITPKNFIFRTREFEQIEIEYFCEPGTDEQFFKEWYDEETRFFTEVLWLDKDKVRFVEIPKDWLPHYSKRAWDFEFLFPFGWWEISTLANRTDYDLKAHMWLSKQDLSYFDPFVNKKYVPYVIEPSIWLSRLVLAAMCGAYDTVDTEEWTRIVLRFKPSIAPIKIAVLPIVKKLWDEAKKIYKELSKNWMCEYDETGNVGKRYFRFDEIWTPFCIVVDDSTVNNNTVTVRDRDTGLQDTVKVTELEEYFRKKLS